VDVTLAYTQMNPVGYDGVAVLPRGRRHAMFGGNLNQWTDESGIHGIRMSRPGFDPTHPGAGTVAVATTWQDVTFSEHWERSGWFDDIQSFWDDFRPTAGYPIGGGHAESPGDGCRDAGAHCAAARRTIGPVVLAWHFPERELLGPRDAPGQNVGPADDQLVRHQWPDAQAAARETLEHLDELPRARAFRVPVRPRPAGEVSTRYPARCRSSDHDLSQTADGHSMPSRLRRHRDAAR
jgi:hypothetical protein